MIEKILTDFQRTKQDNNDDSLFYAQPRFVHHLDEGFRTRLTKFYKQLIPCESVVLDLMSSWVSHLPEDVVYKRVIGHGLNQIELEKNNRLDSFWVQDLNRAQKLPLEDSSVDFCLMVAAWQYLQQPEELAAELRRVIVPNGKLIVSFSNRAFWDKAPRIWIEGSDMDHINYIKAVLVSQGWSDIEYIAEDMGRTGIFKFIVKNSDPFFSVIATR